VAIKRKIPGVFIVAYSDADRDDPAPPRFATIPGLSIRLWDSFPVCRLAAAN